MTKKVLFLCNNLPHNKTAGGILYDQIAKSYGVKNVSIVSVSNPNHKADFSRFNSVKQFKVQFPVRNIFWKVLKKLPIIEEVYTLFKYLLIRNKVLDYVKEINPDRILIQMRGDSLFFVNFLIRKTDIPMVSMIEDTVEREIDGHYLSFLVKKRLYYKCISKMNKIGVPGETMKYYIEKEFKIPTVIMRPWFSRSQLPKKEINRSKVNIIFGGNIYAKKEFNIFINALDDFSFKHKEIDLTFYIASRKNIKYEAQNYKIVQLGWISEKELQIQMNKCDFSYLPYIFDSKYDHSMKYAFPGKAGFYVANNLPILFHGPSYSSFNTFLRAHKIGISCSSLQLNDVVESIEDLINLDSKQLSSEIDKAYTSAFSEEVFDINVNNLLN